LTIIFDCDIINFITKIKNFNDGEFMKRKYSKAIKEIARQNGVTPESVYEEMQKAINTGYNNLDPTIQEYWRRILPDGEEPNPEKIIEALSKEIKS